MFASTEAWWDALRTVAVLNIVAWAASTLWALRQRTSLTADSAAPRDQRIV